jgi:hypothetical protein
MRLIKFLNESCAHVSVLGAIVEEFGEMETDPTILSLSNNVIDPILPYALVLAIGACSVVDTIVRVVWRNQNGLRALLGDTD